jgi:hypothetical protein
VHRDVNGAANICMRARYGAYGQMIVLQQRHCLAL